MISPSDARVLEKLVGTTTFDRGRAYARKGAVRQRTWSPGGTRVVGEVQGGERKPYVTSVSITRAQTGEALHASGPGCCQPGENTVVGLGKSTHGNSHDRVIPALFRIDP